MNIYASRIKHIQMLTTIKKHLNTIHECIKREKKYKIAERNVINNENLEWAT